MLKKRSFLADRVYETFKRDIIFGSFKPGEVLTENFLAHRYATSRTPVREAAGRLERDNLIRIVPNKGYFIELITITELNELYEYRAVVEAATAELAAKKESEADQKKALESLAAVQYKRGDRRSYGRFIEADTAFHVGIARLTRNHLFVNAVADLRNQIERLLYATIDMGDYGELLAAEHMAIYRAICNRDAESARSLMIEHVLGSKTKILQLL